MSTRIPIPHLCVAGGEAAIAFYQKAFGAVVENRMLAKDNQRIMHAHLKIGDGAVMLHDDFPEMDHMGGIRAPTRLGGTTAVIHLDVDDADAAFARAIDAGATTIMAPANQFWGMRYGQLKDPFGHLWSIGGPVKE